MHNTHPNLTQEEISEFKKLVFQVYGIKLDDKEALDQGSRLIQLFELMLKNRDERHTI